METSTERIVKEWLDDKLNEDILSKYYMIFNKFEDEGFIDSAKSALFGKILADAVHIVFTFKTPYKSKMGAEKSQIVTLDELQELFRLFGSRSEKIKMVINKATTV
jgi:hypothetical protein